LDTFRIFLAHSFATDSWNAYGELDSVHGVSDAELAEAVAGWIRTYSEGHIEVVRTRDPFVNYLSQNVRQDIASSDAVLCLFTKRTQDGLTKTWIPSTYVISEGSAALMQFANEDDTHQRLFGLVEEGVDRYQLGMAFHLNKVTRSFARNNLPQLESHVCEIVDQIRNGRTRLQPRKDLEYLSIDKVAYIRQDRSVLVETRHRYRLTAPKKTIRIAHKMWRVSAPLPAFEDFVPTFEDLDAPSPDLRRGFLRVFPLHCGRYMPESGRCKIVSGGKDRWDFERKFFVEFNFDSSLNPGEELAYEIVWGYPDAFHGPDHLQKGRPNSVGMRTCERGPAASASLTLKFERDWELDPYRTLGTRPMLSHNKNSEIPGSYLPEEFLHESAWDLVRELAPCPQRSGTFYEVYYWSTKSFDGMVKATWDPNDNYFHYDENSSAQQPIDDGEGEHPHR
jgi:hypothetical protein